VIFRSGFVTLVGRPNVGKSTLVNALVGVKVAIVSDKPQTTRRDIRGILTTTDAQVVFTDTPGFHKAKTALGARMNDLVGDAVHGVDIVVQVVDGKSGVGRGDAYVYERQVATENCPRFCVVNKIDALTKDLVLPKPQISLDAKPNADAHAAIHWRCAHVIRQHVADPALTPPAIVALMIGFATISPASVWLLAPYLLWVTFAAYLNLTIVRMNDSFSAGRRLLVTDPIGQRSARTMKRFNSE
jgi:small GTP-binding protein